MRHHNRDERPILPGKGRFQLGPPFPVPATCLLGDLLVPRHPSVFVCCRVDRWTGGPYAVQKGT
jgi:hypothetical protein